MTIHRESPVLAGTLVSRPPDSMVVSQTWRLARASRATVARWTSMGARRRARPWIWNIAGVALLAAALVAFGAKNAPLHDALSQGLGTRAQDVAIIAKADAASVTDGGLVDKLPSRAQAPRIIAGLQENARESGIALDKGRYELVADSTPRVAHYRATFPLTAAYPQIRQFVDRTLLQYPSIGVERLQMNRRDVADQTVEAELALSIFVRNAP